MIFTNYMSQHQVSSDFFAISRFLQYMFALLNFYQLSYSSIAQVTCQMSMDYSCHVYLGISLLLPEPGIPDAIFIS